MTETSRKTAARWAMSFAQSTSAVAEVEAKVPRSAVVMFLSVVVCTYNRAGLLGDCLRSLVDQTMSRHRYEVIVVENACTDDTSSVSERLAREHPNVRVLRVPEPGRSRAANAGINAARGTHVAFIDDDGRAPRSWLEQVERAFLKRSPTPVVVLGRVVSAYETTPPVWWEPATAERIRQAGFLAQDWDRHRVCGSNFAFEKKALVECGGFAEDRGPVGSRFRFGEDTEVVFRVADHHPFVWYDPLIVVQHWVPAAKLTLSHLLWRSHLSGIAISEVEGIRLFSWRIPALLLRSARSSFAKTPGPRQLHGLRVRLARIAIRLSTIAGMVRGARLLR